MERILGQVLHEGQAGLWFLGQAGFVVRSGAVTAAIDPYLTDSVGARAPAFARRYPPPIEPERLKVDLFLVTHDHADHLDPETVTRYLHKGTTHFVAPHLAARRLADLGVPRERICRLDAGETTTLCGVSVTGVWTLPTGADALDTTGYLLRFPNGRSVYHAADTGFAPLLLKSAPKAEVLLTPINGKWGNLTVEQALDLTGAVKPRYVVPMHHDLMALNSENPETFRVLVRNRKLEAVCVVPEVMQPFVWE